MMKNKKPEPNDLDIFFSRKPPKQYYCLVDDMYAYTPDNVTLIGKCDFYSHLGKHVLGDNGILYHAIIDNAPTIDIPKGYKGCFLRAHNLQHDHINRMWKSLSRIKNKG